MTTATSSTAGEQLPRRLFFASFTLLATALLFDLVDLTTGTGALGLPAYWLAAVGVVGGVAAGACRLWRIAPTDAASSPWHFTALPGFFKAVAIALCAAGWSLRTIDGDVPAAGLAMAVLGVGFVAAARWLPAGSTGPAAADADALRDTVGRAAGDGHPAPEEHVRAL